MIAQNSPTHQPSYTENDNTKDDAVANKVPILGVPQTQDIKEAVLVDILMAFEMVIASVKDPLLSNKEKRDIINGKFDFGDQLPPHLKSSIREEALMRARKVFTTIYDEELFNELLDVMLDKHLPLGKEAQQ